MKDFLGEFPWETRGALRALRWVYRRGAAWDPEYGEYLLARLEKGVRWGTRHGGGGDEDEAWRKMRDFLVS